MANVLLITIPLLIVGAIMEIGLRFVYPFGYFNYRPDPDIHSTPEFSYRTAKNSWGIRDREFTSEELAYDKIIILGDSMTYGQGVELDYTYPKVSERELAKFYPDTLLINGGGKGTGTLGQFISIKELMKTHEFKAIGFGFFLGNDSDNNIDDFNKQKYGSEINNFSRKTQNRSLQKQLFAKSILYNFCYFNLKLLAYRLGVIPSFIGQDLLRKEYSERGKKGWDVTFDVLTDIKAYFDARPDIKLFFVLLPQDFQVDPNKQAKYRLTEQDYDFLKPNRLLIDFLRKNDMTYLDTTGTFIEHYQNNPDELLYFPIDRHFNEAGHDLIAQLLKDFLKNKIL